MRIAVCVQAHDWALETLKLLEPYYLKAQADVLIGIDAEDRRVISWPQCFTKQITVCVDLGRLHPTRLFNAISCALRELDYDAFLFTEYDSIFLKPLLAPPAPGIVGAFIAGYCPPEWRCGNGAFLHPPFYGTRSTMEHWVNEAKWLLDRGLVGNGTPDVFCAMGCERAGIVIEQLPKVWSTNGLDMRIANRLRTARQEVKGGAWHIHGVKRADHLAYIMGQTDHFPADTFHNIN